MASRGAGGPRAWLAAQARQEKPRTVRIVALGLLGTAAAIAQAWCIAHLLAPILAPARVAPASRAPLWAAVFAALALGRVALAYLAERMSFEAGAAARRRLRTTLLVALFAGGPVLTDRFSPGALAATLVDHVEALDGYFARWRPAATLALAAPLLVAAAVLAVDPGAAAILLLAGLFVPLGMALAGIGAAAASRRQFTALARLQARFVDRVRGIATIVLAGQADAEASRLQQAATELTTRTMRVLRVAFLSSATLDLAAVAALVLLAVRLARAATSADPAAALFPLLLVAEFFAPLRTFAAAYQDHLQAGAAAEHLAALPPAPPAAEAPPRPVRTVQAHGISVAFEDVTLTRDPARGPVLQHLAFRVPPGETAVLVAPSGGGKTSVIELLLGFLRPDSGRITLNGADLDTVTAPALARMVAWIGQRPLLFAATIRDNIRFGRDEASDADIDDAVRAAGLAPVVAALPQGLDTRIGEDGWGLSGGQAQRVAIARAFIRNAPLLLLDEPTAHLDPATEADVLDSLRRLAVGRTVIIAAHASAAAAFAGRRIVLAEAQRRAEDAA